MPPKRISVEIEDVSGSFSRFMRTAPKLARQEVGAAVRLSAFGLGQRMKALAPRSDAQYAPHIQDQIESVTRGMSARVGILEPGSTGIEPDIALFNEYAPNRQPFMRPAAEAEASEFKRAIEIALKRMGAKLSGFGGGLQ